MGADDMIHFPSSNIKRARLTDNTWPTVPPLAGSGCRQTSLLLLDANILEGVLLNVCNEAPARHCTTATNVAARIIRMGSLTSRQLREAVAAPTLWESLFQLRWNERLELSSDLRGCGHTCGAARLWFERCFIEFQEQRGTRPAPSSRTTLLP